ncbi:MAG: peptidylprolyl isomerase, partial [Gammaproteobacteria bacterium]|nr:peptidylprolyl isomerase [Gammaproteobacteria bacterium]
MTKPIIVIILLLGLPMCLAADTLATVNGKAITQQQLEHYVGLRLGAQSMTTLPEKKRRELLEELINRELIYNDATSIGLEKQDEIKTKIEEQNKNLLTNFRIQKLLKEAPVSKKQLQTVYQEQVVTTSSMEYKARHILVEDEETANQIIGKLLQGAIFAELASQMSLGPSKTQGGDLGWFSATQMVKPFAEALIKLEKNKYTQHPIETQYGWHVIYLEDTRKVSPPTYESVEAQLRKVVENEIIADYIEGLKLDA